MDEAVVDTWVDRHAGVSAQESVSDASGASRGAGISIAVCDRRGHCEALVAGHVIARLANGASGCTGKNVTVL